MLRREECEYLVRGNTVCVMGVELLDTVRQYSLRSKSEMYLLIYRDQEGDYNIMCRMVESLVEGDLERI